MRLRIPVFVISAGVDDLKKVRLKVNVPKGRDISRRRKKRASKPGAIFLRSGKGDFSDFTLSAFAGIKNAKKEKQEKGGDKIGKASHRNIIIKISLLVTR